MHYQYFKINRKKKILVKITRCIVNEVGLNFNYNDDDYFFYINKQFLRKIKIQNIENSISKENKKILNFLLNEKNATLVTEVEYLKNINQRFSYSTNTTTVYFPTTSTTTSTTFTTSTTSTTSTAKTLTTATIKKHWWKKILK